MDIRQTVEGPFALLGFPKVRRELVSISRLVAGNPGSRSHGRITRYS
jgi:hypothetical protein